MHLSVLFLLIYSQPTWQFVRPVDAPILKPSRVTFDCPMTGKQVRWEEAHVFNPAAVVRRGKVYLLYRAEDASGEGIGGHTSRIGLAVSKDGIHFTKQLMPVLFPTKDRQKENEWTGGCEDPRVVETADHRYVITYTQWNRKIAHLAVAVSKDLVHWTKYGPIFPKAPWSKSGSIVCRRVGDHMIATKIGGKYWMYWGDKTIHAASSGDLIHWKDVKEVFGPRSGKFDSELDEPGPPAILKGKTITLLFNGKNLNDPMLKTGIYCAGEAVLDSRNPATLIRRSDRPIFQPTRPWEATGQYRAGTVFIEGLVHFRRKWFLYYGAADSLVGVATMKG